MKERGEDLFGLGVESSWAGGPSNKNSYFWIFSIELFLMSFLMTGLEVFFRDSLRWYMARRGTRWRVSVDLCESIHGCGVWLEKNNGGRGPITILRGVLYNRCENYLFFRDQRVVI